MIRLMRSLLYFFIWQRTLAWTSAIGVGLLVLCLVVRPPAMPAVIAFCLVLAVGFPLTLAPIAFRHLISNRRFAFVPRLRLFCVAALLILVMAGSVSTSFISGQLASDVLDYPPAVPTQVLLIAFALISAYVLVSQWLITYSTGLIAAAVLPLPLIVIRMSSVEDGFVEAVLAHPWLLAGAGGIGWIWLFLTVCGPARHRPVAAPRWGASMSNDPGSQLHWQPDWGHVASSAGTLMRGCRDGVQSRLSSVLLALLVLPVALVAVLWLLGGAPFGGAGRSAFATGFFLHFSLFGVAAQSSMVFREWPARLRYLWLRRGGDRREAWRFLDRSLRRDIVLIGAGAAVVAIVFANLTSIDARYFVLYVAGCVILTAVSSYFGFLSRASGWLPVVDVMFIVFVILLFMGNVALLQSDNALNRLYSLLAALAVIAAVLRMLARRSVYRIDWCATRPVRRQRGRTNAA